MSSRRTLPGANAAPLVRSDVAALFVDPLGVYPKLVEHWWDAERDARTYNLTLPLVCHPPCGPWGRLRHLSRKDNPALALLAVEQVRQFGGVLEHPAHSLLWEARQMPRPGELPDVHGGFSIEVNQVDFGHVARKRTWLYIVIGRGARVSFPPPGNPTHWIAGGRHPGRNPNGYHRGYAPEGIKFCSAQQRRRTPVAFAEWLLELASHARGRVAA